MHFMMYVRATREEEDNVSIYLCGKTVLKGIRPGHRAKCGRGRVRTSYKCGVWGWYGR